MGYRVKPFVMRVRENSTQEFIDVGLLGSNADADVDNIRQDIQKLSAKLGESIPVYETTDDMIAHFNEEAGICYVKNSSVIIVDSPRLEIHTTNGNFYKYSSTGKTLEYALDNGGYAILVLSTEQPKKVNDADKIVPRILKNAYSYCGVNKPGGFTVNGQTVNNVQYVSNNGPYFENTAYLNGIQCSNFANAILHGLPYEYSRLADANNANFSSYGGFRFLDDDDNEFYPSANEMAHYAAAHGYFMKTNRLADAEIGDVVFFKHTDPEYVDYNWNGIIHSSIVIGKGRGFIQFVEAGQIPRLSGFWLVGFKPGSSSDAVTITTIAYTDGSAEPKETGEYDSNTYGMFGLARFPLYFEEVIPSEVLEIDAIPETSYSAGSSNQELVTLVSAADNKKACFGIFNLNTHTSLSDNSSGIMVNTKTYSSTYGENDINFINTGIMPSTGGKIVVPFRKDGDIRNVRAFVSARLSDTTSGSSFASEKINLKLYK